MNSYVLAWSCVCGMEMLPSPTMPGPFFTVGIPTYNRDKLLPETLAAVLGQSFTDFEVLVYDNASTDSTQALVAACTDPRVRYVRHAENLGPGKNWAAAADNARGEYVIINQDDDLLHRDFLRRCHDAVAGRPHLAMYAAPVWREQRGRGYQARLLRTNEGYLHDFLLQDQVLYMEGRRMAVSLLNQTYYFLQPSVAIRREALACAGGYTSREDCLHDILTEARVLLQGDLAYDPRPGAMYRDHDDNAWKTYGRRRRKRLLGQTLHLMLAEFQQAGLSWQGYLAAEFAGYSRADLEKAVQDWAWCDAPASLLTLGLTELRERSGLSTGRFYLRMARKLGLWRTLRHLARGKGMAGEGAKS